MIIGTKVNTDKGIAIISKIYITELDILMVKLFYEEENRWVNYGIGHLLDLIENKGIIIK